MTPNEHSRDLRHALASLIAEHGAWNLFMEEEADRLIASALRAARKAALEEAAQELGKKAAALRKSSENEYLGGRRAGKLWAADELSALAATLRQRAATD